MKPLLTLTSLILVAGSAVAADIVPKYDTFNNFPSANYGGSGIPTDPSAVSTVTDNNNTITLALIAHQRYSNPALGNNGAGTFFATPGFNDGLEGQSMGPTWNFGFYVSLDAALNNTSPYYTRLVYGNNTTDAFVTTPAQIIGAGDIVLQDSWNLSMGFLGGIGYDPNAAGQYGIELQVLNAAGAVVGSSAINVNVGNVSVPDAGSTAGLLGTGLLGLAALRRRIGL